METVLGGRGAGYRFRRFEELCVEAFVVLRDEADHLMILLMLMVDSGIPELSGLEDVAWVHRALMVEGPDDSKAAARFLARVPPRVFGDSSIRQWWWCVCVRARGGVGAVPFGQHRIG